MDLIYVRTKNNNSFVIETVQDDLRERLHMLFGYSIRLYCEHIITDMNQKGTDYYTDYINSSPVQICSQEDVIEQRAATDIESSIYNIVKSEEKLSKSDHEFLKNYFYFDSDNRTEKQISLFQ